MDQRPDTTLPEIRTQYSHVRDTSTQMPCFPGGNNALMKYISKYIVYPELARDAGTQGTIYTTFTITETGKVADVAILRGLSGPGAKECNDEVKLLIYSMPRWKPARSKDKPVRVQYNVPIRFILH